MDIEILAILATVVSAFVGGLAGYFTSKAQSKSLIVMKRDELAKLLVEIELDRLKEKGEGSEHSTLAHWVVLRELLEEYSKKSNKKSLAELRDEYNQRYGSVCATCFLHDTNKSPEVMGEFSIQE